jgi:hypothetical protein
MEPANLYPAGTLTQLALYLPIEDLLIPPSAYLQDRKLAADIHSPYVTGKRAFSARNPLPINFEGKRRLPRVIRETTSFVLMEKVIVTEGIFRISAPAKLKEVLREAYDRGQKFIIWKDHESSLPLPKYPDAMESEDIVEEADPAETYGPHIAAGLIKFWYAELREPIVPQLAYKELTRLHGDAQIPSTIDQLVDLISPKSEWSPLPALSRELLVRHLLPVLFEVAAHQETNKMTPDNLAVCFAPTFVCGPDQMEDIKISGIIRRLLAELVTEWSQLRERCGIDPKAIWEDLKAPTSIDDYEDPLDASKTIPLPELVGPVDIETQQSGIIMQDNEAPSPVELDATSSNTRSPEPASVELDATPSSTKFQQQEPPQLPPRSAPRDLTLNTNTAPPLPPRLATNSLPQPQPRSGSDWSAAPAYDSDIKRKPTPTPTYGTPPQSYGMPPPIQGMPPRYSTVFGAADVTGSPSSYIGPVDGFGPPRRGDWSLHDSDAEGELMPHNGSTDSLFAGPSPLVLSSPVLNPLVTSASVTSAPVTSAPVTSAPVTSVLVTSVPVTSTPVTSALAPSTPMTSAPVTSLPMTSPVVKRKPVASAGYEKKNSGTETPKGE